MQNLESLLDNLEKSIGKNKQINISNVPQGIGAAIILIQKSR
jgi:hypothetical protein